jgi:hypothetical protein
MTDHEAALQEKNAIILSMSAKLGAANLHVRELQQSLLMAHDQIHALQHANDRLAADLAASDRFIDRISEKLCGMGAS